MKRRYIYLLLFGLPGIFVSAIISLAVFGAAAGMLWLYVFGDSPWPASSGSLLTLLLTLVFLAVWSASFVSGYVFGKRREKDPILNRRHVLASLGITLGTILLIVMYQVGVGNIGLQSDSTICSDFCARQGYSASSMPPRDSGERTCSCLDQFGKTIVTVPLKSIVPGS
jgi:hypothetical protein